MRKALVICILAISITLMVNVKAYADDEPTVTPSPTPDPITELSIVQGGSTDVNTMMYYYHNVLNTEQQKIARFLIGSYNYMYLNARGFSYNNVTDLDDLIDRFDEFATFIVGIDTSDENLNTSRWSTNFQIYIASIITYAGNQNVSFDVWKNTLRKNLVIPYTSDALDAWTDYYNDPSNNGVTAFGSESRDWVSGIVYPFLLGDYSWASESFQNLYTNFILNNYPILYGPLVSGDYGQAQNIFSFQDCPIPDTVYIQRGALYQYFRYGDYAGNFYYNRTVVAQIIKNDRNYGLLQYSGAYEWLNGDIINYGSAVQINTLIDYAFHRGIFQDTSLGGATFYGDWYPMIHHVVLVDDLNTLSNRQDVYNDYTLQIINGNDWIRKPNPNKQIVWVIDDQVPMVIQHDPNDDEIVNLVSPVEGDDIRNEIVNNTVINNYDIVAPGVQINVPTDWFESEGNYLEYSYNYGLPFFMFVGDLFLTLGELRIFILGGVILLIVAGVLNKFLL